MKNTESQIASIKQIERGREVILVEIALETQKNLIERMIPTEILPYITNENDGLILEALTMR